MKTVIKPKKEAINSNGNSWYKFITYKPFLTSHKIRKSTFQINRKHKGMLYLVISTHICADIPDIPYCFSVQFRLGI